MTGMTVSRSFAFEGASEGGREREGKGKNGKKRRFVATLEETESPNVPGRIYPCVWGIPRCIVLCCIVEGRGTSHFVCSRFLLFQPLHLHSPPVRRGSQVVPRLRRREPFAFGGSLLPLFPLFVLRSSFFVALFSCPPWQLLGSKYL